MNAEIVAVFQHYWVLHVTIEKRIEWTSPAGTEYGIAAGAGFILEGLVGSQLASFLLEPTDAMITITLTADLEKATHYKSAAHADQTATHIRTLPWGKLVTLSRIGVITKLVEIQTLP